MVITFVPAGEKNILDDNTIFVTLFRRDTFVDSVWSVKWRSNEEYKWACKSKAKRQDSENKAGLSFAAKNSTAVLWAAKLNFACVFYSLEKTIFKLSVQNNRTLIAV